jgi:hypothetical protein
MINTSISNSAEALRAWRRQTVERGSQVPTARPLTAIRTLRSEGTGSVATAIVNNSAKETSPRPPHQGSASVFDRRGARAREHEARPPARSSSLLSQDPVNQNQEPYGWRTARKSTKFISGLDRSGTRRGIEHRAGG